MRINEKNRKRVFTENRVTSQIGVYGGLNIPKTVVTGYKKGRYSFDTLLKSIAKWNDVSQFADEDWVKDFRSVERQGIKEEYSRTDIINALVRNSRRVSFFKDDNIAYGAALNEALSKTSEDETKHLRKYFKHKSIDFTKWTYNQETGYMEYRVGDTLLEVKFADNFSGDYKTNVFTFKESIINA